MGMVFVVVQEPSGDLPECGDRIRKRVHANIVSLEGFDEALGDAIRFRALNGSEARDEIESGREGPGLVCRVDAAIVGKPFERVRPWPPCACRQIQSPSKLTAPSAMG